MAVGGARLSKLERHGAILRLVRERSLSTQEEVADALRADGYETTQTTASRDIAQLGLVKVRNAEGRLVYAQATEGVAARLDDLAAAIRRWALTLTPTGSLLVIGTPSGYASALAQAIDEARHPDVAGTIAGDNTIFVAAREGRSGADLAQDFTHHLEGDSE
jgi:transcriptional regulator of arginine metabolism